MQESARKVCNGMQESKKVQDLGKSFKFLSGITFNQITVNNFYLLVRSRTLPCRN